MSSDSRWTGGRANREWQRGSVPKPEPMARLYLLEQLRAYLADCKRFRLDPAYHPTAAGALKMIPWRGDVQRWQVTREFERLSNKSQAALEG